MKECKSPVITSVIDGLQKGQADNSWKVSFFPLNPSGPRRAQLDKFEVGALAEIKAGKDDVWHQAANGETRYVRAIRATEESCVTCHMAMGRPARPKANPIKENDVLGVASLTRAARGPDAIEDR